MITHEVTEKGYRIYLDGVLWFVQEDQYATVYPGETMEERAQNHLADLTRGSEITEEEIPQDTLEENVEEE